MEFESNVGDLASLLKVEKKRAAAMRANSKMVKNFPQAPEFFRAAIKIN